jgi:Immunity protein 70
VSLYLTIFRDDEEIEGCVFGHYSDFSVFRDTIAANLDRSQYPVLMQHSDCDGAWNVGELPALKQELSEIAAAFKELPPVELVGSFEHTAEYRVRASSLFECFHNVDGENAFEALLALSSEARRLRLPILFQ